MTVTPTTRAVARYIEAGSSAACAGCGSQVAFRARVKVQQVICNVYVDGRWDRVEHFHRDCYDVAGQPHGAPDESQPVRPKHRAAAAATATATTVAA
jgi:hypothetical protein